MTNNPRHLEEAASVVVVHSVKVPATQELTRVVVTVWVSVMEDVKERVMESIRTLPVLSWSWSRLDSTRSSISFTNSFSYQHYEDFKHSPTNRTFLATCEGMARTRGKRAKGKTKIMMEEESGRGTSKVGTESPLEGVEWASEGVVGTRFHCPALPSLDRGHSLPHCQLPFKQNSTPLFWQIFLWKLHTFNLLKYRVGSKLKMESNFQQIMWALLSWAGRVEVKVRRQWVSPATAGWPFVPLPSCSCMSLAENRPTYQLSLSQIWIRSCKIKCYGNALCGGIFVVIMHNISISPNILIISQWGRLGSCNFLTLFHKFQSLRQRFAWS